MNNRPSWIKDVELGNVNIFELVQTMSSRKPGKYVLGKAKSNGNPHVVGLYFDDTSMSQGSRTQSSVVVYLDANRC